MLPPSAVRKRWSGEKKYNRPIKHCTLNSNIIVSIFKCKLLLSLTLRHSELSVCNDHVTCLIHTCQDHVLNLLSVGILVGVVKYFINKKIWYSIVCMNQTFVLLLVWKKMWNFAWLLTFTIEHILFMTCLVTVLRNFDLYSKDAGHSSYKGNAVH